MFTREISGLTLTKQVADTLFQNINGMKFRNDESFLATLRALMHKRVPKEESIYLQFNNSAYDAGQLRGTAPKDGVRAFLRNTEIIGGGNGILHIHSFDGSEEANTACFNLLDNGGVGALLAGYETLADVNRWLEQNGKVRARVYINSERKNVLIFVERIDTKRWHLIQSLIPRYFPWYISPAPLNADEMALIKSLTKRYAPEYEEKIEEFAKQFDFRTQAVKNMLRGFETRFERDKLNNIQAQIQQVNNNIENLRNKFSQYYTQLADLNIQETGLIEKINRGGGAEGSEFMEYFICNKSLNLVSVNGGRIEFIVTTTIGNYDPDIFDSDIRNRKSYFYRHYQTGKSYENKEMTDDRIEKLMRAILEREQLKLRVCAVYYLDFANGNYGAKRNYTYPADILRDHMPNQHIQVYACLGGNETYINRAMHNRDYIAAIEACAGSAKSMNLTEHNTGTFFMERICANDVGRIIEMPDGTTKTPLDAVKWLEEQEAMKVAKEEK